MYSEDLITRYQDKTNIELLLIAGNYDGGYTEEATETAKYILICKYGEGTSLDAIWEQEVKPLVEIAEYCSLCKKKDTAYSEPIYFCTIEELDTKGSIPGIIASLALGVGYTKQKLNVIQVDFRLCQDCLINRGNIKNPKAKPKITWEEYRMHPLYHLYRYFGFEEVRTKI